MSGKCFVDTNILVYAHDRSAGVKHQRAQMLLEQLWDSGQGVLSTQVLQELCINLRRKISHPLPVDEVRRLIRDYAKWLTRSGKWSPTPLSLFSRHSISSCAIRLPFGTRLFFRLLKVQARRSSTAKIWQQDNATEQFRL